jgi:hypothetical protein
MTDFPTPEEFKIAEANGISYNNVYNRVYTLGWSVQRAINTPVLKPDMWLRYKEKCEKLGICQNTFHQRIHKGKTPEEASSYPPFSQRRPYAKGKGKITPEIAELAKQNGISHNTLDARVYNYRWDVMKAATTPVKTQFRRKDYEATRS